MANQNLRDHVLNTTSHLRQQLLEAVDRLEQRGGRDRPGTAISAVGTGSQHQSSSASGGGSRLGTVGCMIIALPTHSSLKIFHICHICD